MKNKRFIIALLSMATCVILSSFCTYHLTSRNNEVKEEKKIQVQTCLFIDTWYNENRVITHALGGIDGKTYTNSIDALDDNYQKGKRVFEADFNYTSDGKIILTHDFQETEDNLIDFPDGYVPTYEEFMNNRIYYKYHPSDAQQLLTYMNEHYDMYLVTDVKYEDPTTITSILSELVNMAKEANMESVLDRFIIQFYSEQNYYDIQSVYPFKNYIYSLYAEANKDFEAVKNFCLANKVPVVLMKSSWVKDETTLNVFNENNIKVYVYTLNNLTNIFNRKSQGVYGFVSDYAYNKDILILEYNEIKNKFWFPIDINFN
ncbi:MAG: glycerophosphodiester phosphodiesterase family protein [Bacilli bacterium]|nr:glycerophosphodiester phosphodiesterase family protein [Bacilli bacterium]